MIQHLLLSVLQTMQDGLSAEKAILLKHCVITTFEHMSAEVSEQNKWNLADRFIAVAAIYGPQPMQKFQTQSWKWSYRYKF